MNKVDLHIHTTASDGSDSVPELLEKIQRSGIRVFSVTDHDTIDGALEMAPLVPAGIQYIQGVEFSCVTPCGPCHILGYRYDPADPELQAVLNESRALRSRKLSQRLAALERQFGIRLTEAESAWLWAQKSPGKPHIGKLLVKRGWYPDIKTALTEVVNHCKAPHSRVDAVNAVSALLHAGGIPVWAHPLGGEGERPLSQEEFSAQLTYLRSIGIRGLECFYSRYSTSQIQFLREQAEKAALWVSAGSDFHGTNKVNITLGKLNASHRPVPEEQITLLRHLNAKPVGTPSL